MNVDWLLMQRTIVHSAVREFEIEAMQQHILFEAERVNATIIWPSVVTTSRVEKHGELTVLISCYAIRDGRGMA